MAFKISDHFTLSKSEKIKETNNKVYFYEHKKTKARIIFFDNQNENAAFGLYFKTPCNDSKGTPHILEHSVFEGSNKFPSGNSLDFILNNSLASSFNALTYLDKTGYFFCTSFEKDYLNLLDIYLDFIFFPKLQENTLKKEGHFFKKTKEGYEFNGIVFNEMKNSFFSLHNVLYRESLKHIFPNTNYSNYSGGEPLEIVDLTHQELKEFHNNFYHPSNSTTIIYGKINKRKVFQKLDENFNQFTFREIEIKINSKPIEVLKNVEIEYQDESEENELTLSKDYLLKNIKKEEDHINIELAINALLAYDFSPLRRSIEDSKLCSTIEYFLNRDLQVPVFTLICKGVQKENIEKLNKLIDESITKNSKNISREIKELIIKRYEFTLKENEYYQNQGEDYIDNCVTFANYNLDPLIGLRKLKNLKIVKKTLSGKNLEKFIDLNLGENLILNATLIPKTNLIEKYNQKIEEKLKNKLEILNSKNLDNEILEHEKYLDSLKENPKYNSLKKIRFQDLNIHIQKYDSEIKDNLYLTNLNSSDVVRVSFNFDISKSKFLTSEIFGIYLNLLQQISSKKYNFDELSLRRNKIFDSFSFEYNSYPVLNTKNRYLLFTMELRFLLSDKNEVLNEINENTLNLNFKDKERIKFLLKEQLQALKDSKLNNSMNNSILIARSYLSEIDYLRFKSSSLPLIKFIENLLNDFDASFEDFSNQLEKINLEIFSQNCVVNLGTSKEYIKEAATCIKNITKELNFKINSKDNLNFLVLNEFKELDSNLNFFYPSISDTNFNIMGVSYENFKENEIQLLGFVETYLNQYLWDEVRIKFGAYGSRYFASRPENYGVFFSYSDPKINETFKVYSNTKTRFNLSKFKKYSFEKMKIKYLSNFKTQYRNTDLFRDSFSFYLKNIPDSYRENIIRQSIALSYNDFKELMFSVTKIKNTVKVVATTKERIKDFKEKYKEIAF